ncbi:dihydrodipicolinate reductase [Herbinix hemicellulosilytica]|uniref:4-hydroxy-tetrahydrodipicolinate reductase n=1 Tax=Herbinix hemicellulosilytica TaxID=1564487 RepID=A0A0H5SD76_HERHM|nr:4-hydroxy-tetrahydrodipicolinate reductase [Herbinix hemicellulosilytica]RBP56933.1 dihydrodipicolinate reductase [Herbinix hemicellulosilytica]CRZ33379.1 4-hydroxy-tetrahydrodipicolinate reductase [Herbinix hemicellulosilytica]
MTNIILRGCNGKMGRVVTQLVNEDENVAIVAGIDLSTDGQNTYPVFQSFSQCNIKADVIIDFSSPVNVRDMLDFAIDRGIGIVLCTTGFTKKDLELIEEASRLISILRSANMSMGINLITKLVKEAARVLAVSGFDIEIVEKHHNKKVDAPSGTALALADAINDALNNSYEYVYDRTDIRAPRQKKEIGISAVRGGTIVGEHEIIFAGSDEVIEIKHTAYSKAIFAKGAIQAAKFLHGKPAGMYTMNDVIG